MVSRIFRMVGIERRALNAVKRSLEAEKVPTPSGNRRWATWVIRGFILDDVYKPHAFGSKTPLTLCRCHASRLFPSEPSTL